MPDTPFADRPHLQDGDGPLDARTPEGALPPQRLADVSEASEASDASDASEASEAVSTDSTVSGDPADQIPVPIAMSPAEIDERAQAVEAVRGGRDLEPRTDV
jgi:hypothetical protein